MIEILKKTTLFYYLCFPRIFGFGYNQYKYSIIKRIINNGYKSVKLKDYLDERMVEIPWVINKLKVNKNKKILDVGCTLNFKYLVNFFLKNNQIFFLNIYKEKNNFFSNQISYIQNDIRSAAFRENFFDFITAISVLEHIGYDNSEYNFEKNYIESKKLKKNNEKYTKALLEIKRILKKNGKLYLTLPFGKKQIFKNYMQFNLKEVKKIIKTFKPKNYSLKFYRFNKSEKKWLKTSASKCENMLAISRKNIGISSKSVVLIEMQK